MTPCAFIHMFHLICISKSGSGVDNNSGVIKMSLLPVNSIDFPIPLFQMQMVLLNSSTIQEGNTCVSLRATRLYILFVLLAITILFRKKIIKLKIIDLCCHKKEY